VARKTSHEDLDVKEATILILLFLHTLKYIEKGRQSPSHTAADYSSMDPCLGSYSKKKGK
jgi:hypothetical protein